MSKINYDEFGEYLNNKKIIENKYEITKNWQQEAILRADPDDCEPPDGELEIEYNGIYDTEKEDILILNIAKYYDNFECDGVPLKGDFTIKEFINKEVEASFEFEFVNYDDQTAIYKLKLTGCDWI